VLHEHELRETALDLIEEEVRETAVGRQIGGERGADQRAAGLVVEAVAQRRVARRHHAHHALRCVGQQVLGQTQQEAAVARQLDLRALGGRERAAAFAEQAEREQEDRDQARRHLVHLGDRHAVDGRVPARRAEHVDAHHRVHETHHGRRPEALAVPIERTRQHGAGEEVRGIPDTASRSLVAESAGERHRQSGVLVQERGDETRRESRNGETLAVGFEIEPCALADQIHVEPVGNPLHVPDERHELGRRVLHLLDAACAGLLQHVDETAEGNRRHECGVGIGDDVAQHRVGAHELELVCGHRDAHRGTIPNDCERRILGESLRHAVEVDLSVERRQERLLRRDPGENLFESGGHGHE
jgi:hypothetical protein